MKKIDPKVYPNRMMIYNVHISNNGLLYTVQHTVYNIQYTVQQNTACKLTNERIFTLQTIRTVMFKFTYLVYCITGLINHTVMWKS